MSQSAAGTRGPSEVWEAAGGRGHRRGRRPGGETGPGSYLAPAASAARGCRAPRPRRTGHCGSSGCRRRGAPPRSLRAWGPSRGRAGELGGASVTARRRARLRARRRSAGEDAGPTANQPGRGRDGRGGAGAGRARGPLRMLSYGFTLRSALGSLELRGSLGEAETAGGDAENEPGPCSRGAYVPVAVC